MNPPQTPQEADTTSSPAELLVQHRKEVGWNQKELARRLGTTSRSVRNWEAGVNTPRPEVMRRIVELYMAAGSLTPGREHDEIRHLWQRIKQTFDAVPGRFQTYPLLDEEWLEHV